jgi:glycosyltransferase involved in cell wall biosynthesis
MKDESGIHLDTPHVTVCVPAYNAARTIRKTIDSILAQDYPNFDVLLCDNLSSDDTAEIVKGYADKGVRYFLNPVLQKWAEGNWNYALSLVEGPLIALYHADDLYCSTMVRRQVEFLQKIPQASAVFTMSQIIDEQDRPIRMSYFRLPDEYQGQDLFPFPDLMNAVLKHTNFFIVPTMMARKTVLNQVGHFNWQRFFSAADIDLYLRMAQEGPLGVINDPLHKYRMSAQQGTNVINKSRTHLAHYFWVMDDWLSRPEMNRCVESSARKIYEMYRASDMVMCAMNMLVLKQPQEAKKALSDALNIRVLMTAIQRPKRLLVLLMGMIMLSSASIGLGSFAGHILYKANQWYLKRRQQALNDI